ncbi:alpha/beta fold hydrolase [Streptomyces roseolilacinus]|uniref:alpha/beta fold hydrolase n=1 Tax=Streptomyces roseolilacinus TaxID=66904 RepID=UPI0038227D83
MTLEFRSSDGLAIRYYAWGSGDALPPVFLHHGFIADAHLNWVDPGIVTALVARGRRVYALDARGHGASDKPHDPARYGEEAMARDLRGLIDLSGAEHAHLVGYSMGAVVSLLAAAEDKRVTRLVVGGVGAGVVEVGGVDTRVVPSAGIEEAFRADDPATLPAGAAGFRAFADAVGADRLALAAHARVLYTGPLPLDRISAPTLVLAGADDPLAARPEVLAAAVAGAALRVLPGDHLAVMRHPDFAAAVADFLTPAD